MIIAKNSTLSGSLKAIEYKYPNEYGDITDFLTSIVSSGTNVVNTLITQQAQITQAETQVKLAQLQAQAAAQAQASSLYKTTGIEQYIPYILIGGSALVVVMLIMKQQKGK
jgi:hypothetical protein